MKSIKTLTFFLILISSLQLKAQELTFEKHMVLMPDSVHLATFVFRADTTDSLALPSILIRTKEDIARYFTITKRLKAESYNVVIQHCRGNGESEGKENFFLTDQDDGKATLDWLGHQAWSDSSIGLLGYNMDGYLSYILAASGHPYLNANYTFGAPFDFYKDVAFPGGAFRQNFIQTWFNEIGSQFLFNALEFRPHYTAFWHPLSLKNKADNIKIPIKHVGGWFQPFLSGTIQAYNTIAEHGQNPGKTYQNLLIGPWAFNIAAGGGDNIGELTLPAEARLQPGNDIIEWFDRWLRQARPDSLTLADLATSKRVKYFLLSAENDIPGANAWHYAPSWPLKEVTTTSYFLRKNGRFGPGKPDETDNAEALKYDPVFPVPTTGGANAFLPSGPMDQREIEIRNDVLTFTSDTLTEHVAVAGAATIHLFASSTGEDTDFMVKLQDVTPDGRSLLIAEGHVKARHRNSFRTADLLTPKRVENYQIEIGHIAYVFGKGHQIRVSISSSNSPKIEANPNSAMPFGKPRKKQVVLNYIYYGGKRPSHVNLPIIPLEKLTE